MNLGEIVGGAFVVWVVGSQVRGMFRSASKRAQGSTSGSAGSSAAALVREALAEKATTGQAVNLRDILAAAREAQGASAAAAFDAGPTEGLSNVLEAAREIARQAREHPGERVDLQALANAARSAAARVAVDDPLADRHGKKKRAKQQQPHAHHDVSAPHAGGRPPLHALGAMPPLRKLHPMTAASALAPLPPLSPYV